MASTGARDLRRLWREERDSLWLFSSFAALCFVFSFFSLSFSFFLELPGKVGECSGPPFFFEDEDEDEDGEVGEEGATEEGEEEEGVDPLRCFEGKRKLPSGGDPLADDEPPEEVERASLD